ncbi:MAG: ADP-ribosylglycohydrolase family protein, partial [Ignavibacteriaceae bacterium]|nr:ADP-ribosylglycohydrolase family protein [Ignavibacteriaceae bacterium]
KQWGRVTDFLSDTQSGSDDTEYALFSSKILIDKKWNLKPQDVAAAWRKDIIKSSNTYKGAGFSEMLTIQNLLKGMEPPQSGQHLHSWSDGLAMRAAPYGIACAGNPELAAKLTEIDGSISHSGEGIFGGQAVAAAAAMAMTGSSVEIIFQSALNVVPKDSWTASSITRAIQIGNNSADVWNALEPLYDSVVCKHYFWSDIAPEAVGLAFGIIAASKGKFEDAVLGAVNVGRDTDTIAAITGAICGALNGVQIIPEKWINKISVSQGMCINAVKGLNIIEVADELALLAELWSKQQ